MVRRFRGEFHQKVDGKGRVSIPADFRRVLETGDPTWSDGKAPEFVVVYGDHRRAYLECYTIDAANEVDAQIGNLPRGSIERRMLERLFNVSVYFKAYAPMSLDQYLELLRLRNAGVWTPAVPPDGAG